MRFKFFIVLPISTFCFNLEEHSTTCGKPEIKIDEEKLFNPENYRGLIEYGQSGHPEEFVVYQGQTRSFISLATNLTLPSKRVVGGSVSQPGSWPWHVRVKLCSIRGSRPVFCVKLCGGSLISSFYALTAAHCKPSGRFSQESAIFVGEFLFDENHDYDLDDNKNHIYGKRYFVEEVVRHEAWSKKTRKHDIAVIKTRDEVGFTDYVKPLCLPKHDELCFQPKTKCVVVGWGYLKERGPTSQKLMQVAVEVLDHQTCNSKDWYNGYVSEGMVCAGFVEGGRDSCSGDSGGALICKNNDDGWVQYGIVSWGYTTDDF